MDQRQYADIKRYLEEAEYPKARVTDKEQKKWRNYAAQFTMDGQVMWKFHKKRKDLLIRVITKD